MLRRFLSFQGALTSEFKHPLRPLHPDDPEQNIVDLPGYFDHVMQTAEMHKINGKLALPLRRLRKIAYLAKQPKDAQVLDTAFWTYCGHEVWPHTFTTEIIVQAFLNLDQLEYAHDVRS